MFLFQLLHNGTIIVIIYETITRIRSVEHKVGCCFTYILIQTFTKKKKTRHTRTTRKRTLKSNLITCSLFFVGFFLVCMIVHTYVRLPDCERLIFFLMLVFDVFFLSFCFCYILTLPRLPCLSEQQSTVQG